jgi:hypothetical protein
MSTLISIFELKIINYIKFKKLKYLYKSLNFILINPGINVDLAVTKERLYQEYIGSKKNVYLVFIPLLL